MPLARINTNMSRTTFRTWLQHCEHSLPEPDRVVQVIAKAGPAGVSRRDLIGEIELHWRILDTRLQQLVHLRQLSAVRQGNDIVFRLANPMLAVFDV